jgi:hypothetical protein
METLEDLNAEDSLEMLDSMPSSQAPLQEVPSQPSKPPLSPQPFTSRDFDRDF